MVKAVLRNQIARRLQFGRGVGMETDGRIAVAKFVAVKSVVGREFYGLAVFQQGGVESAIAFVQLAQIEMRRGFAGTGFDRPLVVRKRLRRVPRAVLRIPPRVVAGRFHIGIFDFRFSIFDFRLRVGGVGGRGRGGIGGRGRGGRGLFAGASARRGRLAGRERGVGRSPIGGGDLLRFRL